MNAEKGSVVRSLAGHDKGKLLCVLEAQDGFLFLADGAHRRVSSPKRKRMRHVERVGELSQPLREKLLTGEVIRDRELWQALAALRDELEV